MRGAVMVMGGLVAGGTVFTAAYGTMPDDLGLVLLGVAVSVGALMVLAKWEDEN